LKVKNQILSIFCVPLVLVLLAGCGAHVYHQVKRDETLYSISFRYGQDFRDVARWNGIEPPYNVKEGQLLRVAPPLREAGAPKPQPPAPVAARPTTPESAVRVIPLQPQAEPEKPPPAANSVAWQWPARGTYKRTAGNQSGRLGLDILGVRGAPIAAAADGRVVYGGAGIARYGNLLIIKHDERFLSAYAHTERILVHEGDFVRAGQTVAEMGSSGTGTSVVKLHFEIRLDGEPVDPLQYLPSTR
jgi:lipoprotein NlpD